MNKQANFFWLAAAEAIICLALLLVIPSDPKNTGLLGFSAARLLAAAALLLSALISAGVAANLQRDTPFWHDLRAFMRGSPHYRKLGIWVVLLMLLGVLLGGLFLVAWFYLPPRFDTILLRVFPLALFAALVCLQGLLVLDAYREAVWQGFKGGIHWLVEFSRSNKIYLIIAVLFTLLAGVRYYQLADRHSRLVNIDPNPSDQDDYLYQARQVQQTDFHYKGDRKRMPIYLDLLALIYRPGEDMLDFFQRGKQANIILSLLLLAGVVLISWKFLPLAQSALLAFVAGAGLFVYKAGYVQPELLYYFLSYASFLLMGWMLVRPSVWLGALTGAAAALAYLTKASLLASVALFAALFAAKLLLDWFASRRKIGDYPADPPGLWGKAVGLAVMLAVFLGLLSPYLLENKRLFGQYFYNANSTFYIWYDSLEQAMSGTWAHGDDVGWPDLPPEQIPSMRKYLREHTPDQIQARFLRGVLSQYVLMEKPYGRFNYLVIYSLVALGFVLLLPRASLRLLRRYWHLALFALIYFAGSLVMISWFAATTNYYVARFSYALYLPYLFSMFLALDRIVKESNHDLAGSRNIYLALLWAAHSVVFALVLYDFLCFTAPRLAGWYGK